MYPGDSNEQTVSRPRGPDGSVRLIEAWRYAEITEAAISVLIDRFYAAIRLDPVLAPIFEAAIQPEEWKEHLATMRRFWSSVMLTSGRYSGNPVAVHRAVLGIERPMFPHWLSLFETTARELFAPDLAEQFAVRSRRIAGSLELAIFHRLGSPPDGLTPPGSTTRPSVRCD
jgi:hemoglobin